MKDSLIFDKHLFSLILDTRRHKQKLSVRKAAHQIGISAATYSRIAKGNVPDLLTFGRCCQWLSRDMGIFFYLVAYGADLADGVDIKGKATINTKTGNIEAYRREYLNSLTPDVHVV